MPTPILGGRPDLDQDVDTLALYITGSLPTTAPLVAYEGRLQIHNAVGACQVDQIAGSTLPPGSQLYVDQDTDEIVLAWPAYSSSAAALTNPGFDLGNTSGWTFEYKGGAGSVAADTQYRHQGTHSLRFTGAKGLGSEGGIELSAVNNAAGVAYPNQQVTASVRGMYNPAGHNFGCRYQARLRWLDGLGATISESLGPVIKGRGNNGDWIEAPVTAVAPAGTEAVKLVGWATSKGPPTWLDTALWNLPVTIGINVDTVLSLTLRVRDSAGRTAIWTGTVTVTTTDPVAISIYNKLFSYWNMDEFSDGSLAGPRTDGLHNATSHPATFGNFQLTDGGAGRIKSNTGLRGTDRAAQFGNTSGAEFVIGNTTEVSIVANKSFAVFGWLRTNAWGDGVNGAKAIISRTQDAGASTTEFALFSWVDSLITWRVKGVSVTCSPPSTGAFHFFVAWWDEADQKLYLQIDNGTVFVSAGTVAAVLITAWPHKHGRLGGGAYSIAAGSNEARMQLWGYMRNGNFPSSTERTWLYNAGQGRTLAEIKAAAGIP